MRFELITLSGTKYQGEVAEVSLRSAGGQIAILPGHETLTTIVRPGPIGIKTSGKQRFFATFGGLVEITAELVRLLSDEAEAAEDLNESEIKAAMARAREIEAKASSMHDVHKARELVGRHNVRLEVARLHRRHHRT